MIIKAIEIRDFATFVPPSRSKSCPPLPRY